MNLNRKMRVLIVNDSVSEFQFYREALLPLTEKANAKLNVLLGPKEVNQMVDRYFEVKVFRVVGEALHWLRHAIDQPKKQKQWIPDLIITDINFSELNGLVSDGQLPPEESDDYRGVELVKQLQGLVPIERILLCTNYSREPLLDKCNGIGLIIDQIARKGVDPSDLRRKVQPIIKDFTTRFFQIISHDRTAKRAINNLFETIPLAEDYLEQNISIQSQSLKLSHLLVGLMTIDWDKEENRLFIKYPENLLEVIQEKLQIIKFEPNGILKKEALQLAFKEYAESEKHQIWEAEINETSKCILQTLTLLDKEEEDWKVPDDIFSKYRSYFLWTYRKGGTKVTLRNEVFRNDFFALLIARRIFLGAYCLWKQKQSFKRWQPFLDYAINCLFSQGYSSLALGMENELPRAIFNTRLGFARTGNEVLMDDRYLLAEEQKWLKEHLKITRYNQRSLEKARALFR